MSVHSYLIDTNVFIGLEDNKQIKASFSAFSQLCVKHSVELCLHEASRDDINQDKEELRRRISLSKTDKFRVLKNTRGLTETELSQSYGPQRKRNDIVDSTLLYSLDNGHVDFLVTEDKGIHSRVRRYAQHLEGRVLYVADAVSLLNTSYEKIPASQRHVDQVEANEIKTNDPIFESLRADYEGFDDWWQKCVRARRICWAVYDEDKVAGLVVRKDEPRGEARVSLPGDKILKVCTFKVRPENRGVKLGELLLRQVLWFAQMNQYDLVYLTTFSGQSALMSLLRFYGFEETQQLDNGEYVYERIIGHGPLALEGDLTRFDAARINYPRFYAGSDVSFYHVPIQEQYHDQLFPELMEPDTQFDLFNLDLSGQRPRRPGNTIRKVYLCKAQTNSIEVGSVVLFYKSQSIKKPSQSYTCIGVVEDYQLAKSSEEVRRLAGGRSVYTEAQINNFKASPSSPVKVMNFLLCGYLKSPLSLKFLQEHEVMGGYPPQSISKLKEQASTNLLPHLELGFGL